jgi:hypothetical protein
MAALIHLGFAANTSIPSSYLDSIFMWTQPM